MSRLNVLYCANDGYAPFMGTSILSLFKNNMDIEEIKVYCVLDSVSQDNIKKLNSLAKEFNRQIKIIDSGEINLVLNFVDIPKYRGSNVANYRLFLDLILDDSDERVLYLDSDTIVTGSLKPLLELDMQDKICAVVLDALASHYKRFVGFSRGDLYFNSGVMMSFSLAISTAKDTSVGGTSMSLKVPDMESFPPMDGSPNPICAS